VNAGLRFPAIGTTAHLLVTDASALPAAAAVLRGLLADLDAACSRFRADSALSRLNEHGGPLAVGPVLVAAMRVALRAAEATGGLVDPTLGRALVAIGYDRTFTAVPAVSPLPVVPAGAGDGRWRGIRIDGDVVTLPTGVHLDLGATAKAWAADRAAELIAAELGCGVLVNLGGDLAVAGLAPTTGWRVRLAEDHTATGPGGAGRVVAVRGGGVATSSTTVRRWQRAGVRLHHVLDPRTGTPALPVWDCVSVAAASCVDANTAATAAVVLGAAAPEWLARLGLPARLVAAGSGEVRTVAGWPADRTAEAAPRGAGATCVDDLGRSVA
jgi:FAD:protein FMN transferase